jgi:hypothetical protein
MHAGREIKIEIHCITRDNCFSLYCLRTLQNGQRGATKTFLRVVKTRKVSVAPTMLGIESNGTRKRRNWKLKLELLQTGSIFSKPH